MTHVSNVYRVFIHTTPEKVFDYVSDLTRHPEWSGGDLRIESLTPEPVRVGSRYKSFGEVAVQKNRPNELLVTHYEPPTRFTFTAQDPDFGEVINDFKFISQNGGTLMERTLTMKMNPWMAFAFKFFIQPLIGQPMMDKAFGRLREKLETRE
jgi:uncharacterized protein YndB with AHSA1/START domain